MTVPAGEGVTGWLAAYGPRDWKPPGRFDAGTGVWFTDDSVDNRFPAEGIERFGRVDDRSFWFAHRNGVILDRLERQGGERSLFIEVGSGSGVVARYLQAAGYPVAAVEPHVAGAVLAARRGTTASFCGDLESLQLPDNSIRHLGAFDVVEHLDDPRALLAEIRRVLTPDGTFVMTVPAFQWLWSDVDEWNGHVERFNVARLAEVVATGGLRLTEHSYFFAPLVVPAYLTRVVRRVVGGERAPEDVGAGVETALDPPRLVDAVLRSVHALERRWLRRLRIPFGTSLLGVARPA